jgi:hypothetical protein
LLIFCGTEKKEGFPLLDFDLRDFCIFIQYHISNFLTLSIVFKRLSQILFSILQWGHKKVIEMSTKLQWMPRHISSATKSMMTGFSKWFLSSPYLLSERPHQAVHLGFAQSIWTMYIPLTIPLSCINLYFHDLCII